MISSFQEFFCAGSTESRCDQPKLSSSAITVDRLMVRFRRGEPPSCRPLLEVRLFDSELRSGVNAASPAAQIGSDAGRYRFLYGKRFLNSAKFTVRPRPGPSGKATVPPFWTGYAPPVSSR